MNPKVFYIQQFFNEIELLPIKLETIYPVVDGIVLSESNKTHSGKPKEYNLKKVLQSGVLDKYKDKLHIQFVDDTPSNESEFNFSNYDVLRNLAIDKLRNHTFYDKNQESYVRDSYEKEILIRGLFELDVSANDIVIFSDMDEIIRPEVITNLKTMFDPDRLYRFDCDFYYYRLNLLSSETWVSPIAVSYKNIMSRSLCEMRNFGQGVIIYNAGWHFSYLGNADKIKTKLESFGEQSLNLESVKNNLGNVIDDALNRNVDLYGRNKRFQIVHINNDTMPEYIVDHQKELHHLILPYGEPDIHKEL